jgi:hypothetical protein
MGILKGIVFTRHSVRKRPSTKTITAQCCRDRSAFRIQPSTEATELRGLVQLEFIGLATETS